MRAKSTLYKMKGREEERIRGMDGGRKEEREERG